jgi:hypothetical protein
MTESSIERFEPTPGERRNKWTTEALNEYIRQREKAALIRVFGDPKDQKKRPLIVQRKFHPHYWRKGKPR